MKLPCRLLGSLLMLSVCCGSTRRLIPIEKVIPPGSRVFISDSHTGFGAYIPAALQYKRVPLLVVLDRDYFTVPDEDLKRMRSLLTVVGGKVVHNDGIV